MSAERRSADFDSRTKDWCKQIAALATDALADAGIVRLAELQRAADVVSEEIYARLSVHGYPPGPDSRRGDHGVQAAAWSGAAA